MGIAAYEIVGSENEWRIQHDGKAENVYTTKERHSSQRLLLLLWPCVRVTKCE